MSLFISILVFILVLAVLVVVHEFGHFIVAKKSGIRVDEFGFGFPPRIAKLFKRGDTVFTLNWIPFGGFVKIFGENGEDVADNPEDAKRSFVSKSKWTQAGVLFAGPFFNLLFAGIILSGMFFFGSPALFDDIDAQYISNLHVAVVEIMPGSPAETADILVGDKITSLIYGSNVFEITNPADMSGVINDHGTQELTLVIERKGEFLEVILTPSYGLYEDQNNPALGVALDTVGTLHLPVHKAIIRGFEKTWELTTLTAGFLFDLILGIFSGDKTNLGAVTGPIGIVPVVGEALQIGFSFVVIITALISINLAIINLLPFPALDGGRLLFILIESIKGSPINPKTASIINASGFFILILLMLLVTIRDISHLL